MSATRFNATVNNFVSLGTDDQGADEASPPPRQPRQALRHVNVSNTPSCTSDDKENPTTWRLRSMQPMPEMSPVRTHAPSLEVAYHSARRDRVSGATTVNASTPSLRPTDTTELSNNDCQHTMVFDEHHSETDDVTYPFAVAPEDAWLGDGSTSESLADLEGMNATAVTDPPNSATVALGGTLPPSQSTVADTTISVAPPCPEYIFIDNHDGTAYLADASIREDGSYVLGHTILLAQSLRSAVSPVPSTPSSQLLPHQERLQQTSHEGRPPREDAQVATTQNPISPTFARVVVPSNRSLAQSRDWPSVSLPSNSVWLEQTTLRRQSLEASLRHQAASPAVDLLSLSFSGQPAEDVVIDAPRSAVTLDNITFTGWVPIQLSSSPADGAAHSLQLSSSTPSQRGGASPAPAIHQSSWVPRFDGGPCGAGTYREGSVSRALDFSSFAPSTVESISRRLSLSSWTSPLQRIALPPATPLEINSVRDSSLRDGTRRVGLQNVSCAASLRGGASPQPLTPETPPPRREGSPSRHHGTAASDQVSSMTHSLQLMEMPSSMSFRPTSMNITPTSTVADVSLNLSQGAYALAAGSRAGGVASHGVIHGADSDITTRPSTTSEQSQRTAGCFRTMYFRRASKAGLPVIRGTLSTASGHSMRRAQHHDPAPPQNSNCSLGGERSKGMTDTSKKEAPRRDATGAPDTTVFLPWSPLTITPECSVNLNVGATPESTSGNVPRGGEEVNDGTAADVPTPWMESSDTFSPITLSGLDGEVIASLVDAAPPLACRRSGPPDRWGRDSSGAPESMTLAGLEGTVNVVHMAHGRSASRCLSPCAALPVFNPIAQWSEIVDQRDVAAFGMMASQAVESAISVDKENAHVVFTSRGRTPSLRLRSTSNSLPAEKADAAATSPVSCGTGGSEKSVHGDQTAPDVC